MSGISGISLDINLRPSRRLAAVLVVSHAGAVVCILFAPMPFALKLLLPLPVVAGLVQSLRRYALLTHRRSAERVVFGDTRRRLFFHGRPVDTELLPGTVSTRQWVILRGKTNHGKRLALPLAPDMMSADQWRRLRVWLNVKADAGDGEPDTERKPAKESE